MLINKTHFRIRILDKKNNDGSWRHFLMKRKKEHKNHKKHKNHLNIKKLNKHEHILKKMKNKRNIRKNQFPTFPLKNCVKKQKSYNIHKLFTGWKNGNNFLLLNVSKYCGQHRNTTNTSKTA